MVPRRARFAGTDVKAYLRLKLPGNSGVFGVWRDLLTSASTTSHLIQFIQRASRPAPHGTKTPRRFPEISSKGVLKYETNGYIYNVPTLGSGLLLFTTLSTAVEAVRRRRKSWMKTITLSLCPAFTIRPALQRGGALALALFYFFRLSHLSVRARCCSRITGAKFNFSQPESLGKNEILGVSSRASCAT